MALAPLFLDKLSESARRQVSASPGLEALLEGVVASGRASWPAIEVDPAELVCHLAERLSEGDGTPVVEALKDLHSTDFYLAFACAQGEPRALEALDAHFLSDLSRHLGRADVLRGFADEVKQELRMRLLIRQDDGVLPRIGSYSGRGPLGGWLRIAIVRLAVKLRKSAGRGEEGTQLLHDQAARDPELAYFKDTYRTEFESALRAAL